MIARLTDSELIRVICELRQIEELRVTTNTCFTSALGVGAAAGLGGLLFGPRGIVLGSLVGGAIASVATEGQFRSVPDILMNDLTDTQQRTLGRILRRTLSVKNIMETSILISKLTTDFDLIEILISIIQDFLRTVMKFDV